MSKITKIQVPINKLSGDTFSVNFMIPNQVDVAGRGDIIKQDFVDKEVKNAINGVDDYELRRFKPYNAINLADITELTYQLYDESGNAIKFTDSQYLGFSEDDIRLNRNRFIKSSLQLDFYTTEHPTNNAKVFSLRLSPTRDAIYLDDITNMDAKFVVASPYLSEFSETEGFYQYYYRSELPELNDSVVLYMEASFNNAKDGKVTNLMTVPSVSDVNEMITKIYTNFNLRRQVNRYEYTPEGTNISYKPNSHDKMIIKLYPRLII